MSEDRARHRVRFEFWMLVSRSLLAVQEVLPAHSAPLRALSNLSGRTTRRARRALEGT